MTVVAVHQPNFAPYLGFFRKMSQADVFILYDTAQYSKNEYHNRNRIKTPRGPAWITVPVRSPALRPLREVEIDNSAPWASRIWRTLEANYRRAAHFEEEAEAVRGVLLDRPWPRLVDLNVALLLQIRRRLNLRGRLVPASDLTAGEISDPVERLIEMTRAVGGDVYLSGPGGKDYLDPGRFADVALAFVTPKEVVYPQPWGPFVPNLSVLDALFNCGADARDLL